MNSKSVYRKNRKGKEPDEVEVLREKKQTLLMYIRMKRKSKTKVDLLLSPK